MSALRAEARVATIQDLTLTDETLSSGESQKPFTRWLGQRQGMRSRSRHKAGSAQQPEPTIREPDP